jgi:hypothetical protein
MQTVLLRLSLAGNLEEALTYIPPWDRIEGAWLWIIAMDEKERKETTR